MNKTKLSYFNNDRVILAGDKVEGKFHKMDLQGNCTAHFYQHNGEYSVFIMDEEGNVLDKLLDAPSMDICNTFVLQFIENGGLDE